MIDNMKIGNYLDIWRGASYSLILSVFILQVIELNVTLHINLILALIVITFYIVMDSSVRFHSRGKIRNVLANDQIIVFGKHLQLNVFEFFIFFLELLGLVFIANTIRFTNLPSSSLDFKIVFNDMAFLSFLITVIVHNYLQIGASTSKKFFEYCKISLFQDSLNIESVRKDWLKYYESRQRKLIKEIIKESDDLKKNVTRDHIESARSAMSKSEQEFKRKKLSTHLLTQLTSIHLIILNTIFVFLYFTKINYQGIFDYLSTYIIYNNNIITISSIIASSFFIILVITIILYYSVTISEVNLINKLISEDEKSRHGKERTDEAKEELIEKILTAINSEDTNGNKYCQAFGNIFFILSLICLYLFVISFSTSYLYFVVISQQILISLVIILGGKGS